MARNIFRFFDLPLELREMVYSNLTDTNSRCLQIEPPHLPRPTNIRFRHVWIPRLLLVNKQFKTEYFDYVCLHHLRCAVPAVESRLRPECARSNPGSAIACLSLVRTLICVTIVDKDWTVDRYALNVQKYVAPLLTSFPRVKTIVEKLVTHTSIFVNMIRRGNYTASHEYHGEATQFMAALRHAGITRSIAYRRQLWIAGYLQSNLQTRTIDKTTAIYYRATSMLGKEKEEHLWYGLALDTAQPGHAP